MALLPGSVARTARLPHRQRYPVCGALMNFELFDAMTPEEAREHLQGFLNTERVAMDVMVPAAQQAGVRMDHSIHSLPSVLKWILTEIQIVRVPVPATEPEWIRDFHKDGLIDFPDE